MESKIWLSSPHMSGKEQKYVQEAFDTNWVAPLGPNVNGFEAELAKYVNIQHVAALSSGTSAIHLALILLGVEQGDEVLCSSFTFSASANPILYQKAIPIFIDSEMDTWNMNPDLLEEAIIDRIKQGKKPKAIISVHLYGMPAQIDKILKISEKYEIPLIEDAAEALGSRYLGKACGTYGKMGILSFNGNKIITTSGGGALMSDDKNLIDKSRFLATQARDDAPHYQHSHIGYNYRMSNILAGIGRGQLEVIEQRVAQRRANYNYYYEHLNSINGILFQEEPDSCFSNRWLTTILIDQDKLGITRENIRIALEQKNIELRPLWKPMHQQPIFEKYPAYTNGVSSELFAKGLCLPSGSNMTDVERQRVLNEILYVING